MGFLSRLFGRPEAAPQGPPPPRTTEERAREKHERIVQMIQDQSAADPRRAQQYDAERVDGVHYLELVEPIKQAKREGRNEDALKLCYQAIEGAQRGRQGREPAPAYTRHAAIILRKLKRPDEEVAVLERYLALMPEEHREGHEFAERLAKVRELQRRAQD